MAEIIRMPKLSDTMTEGVVATWLKKVGEEVEVQFFRGGDLKKFRLLLGFRQPPQVGPVSSLIKNRNIESICKIQSHR